MLLLGGGHAHVHVLHSLGESALVGAELMLVTPFARQMYSGMLPGLVAGHYGVDDCVIPLAPLAMAANVGFVEASAIALDAAQRTLRLSNGIQVEYDLLSIDTGPVMDRDSIPGARVHGLFLRPIEHFVRRLDGLLGLAARRTLGVVAIGAGAAGVELALALALRLRGLGDGASRVALVTGGGPPLAGYPTRVVEHAVHALRAQQVTLLQEPCVEVCGDHVVLGDGARLPCDAALLVVGASAPAWLAGSGLTLDARGFIATGPTLQSTSHASVFAAGDVATRTDAPHPKSGVYAVRAGPPLAANLRRCIGGGTLLRYTPPSRTLNLLSCGERRAIASWGPWSVEGRWVWHWKDHIDRAFVAHYTRTAATA